MTAKSNFTTVELDLKPDSMGRFWTLLKDIIFDLEYKGSSFAVIIPQGEEYDLATSHPFTRGIVPRTLAPKASLIHDMLYRYAVVYSDSPSVEMRGLVRDGVAREQRAIVLGYDYQLRCDRRVADRAFFHALLASGVPLWKARAAWFGVRIGGIVGWKKWRKINP